MTTHIVSVPSLRFVLWENLSGSAQRRLRRRSNDGTSLGVPTHSAAREQSLLHALPKCVVNRS